uniref:Uncharacterized protein n=2 Tax=Dunaliella tertiolecta TaxID=3047 RepID=A0A7S3R0U4_DUNTE
MFGASMLAPLGPLQGSKGSTRLVGGAAGEGASAASVPHQPLQPSLESLKGGISHLAKQEVAVRPFASAGASLQLGWFQRPALDYTRLVAKLDLGVPGSAQQAAGSSNMHPAFGLEQRGVWHALTLSLRQQLMGPLRFCADLRYSLDSKQPWNNTPALATPPPPPTSTGPIPHPGQQSIPTKARRGNRATEGACNLARHVGGMRPSLLESTYGLDLVLPGMSGFGRLVAWYAPGRKEGMLELRLF